MSTTVDTSLTGLRVHAIVSKQSQEQYVNLNPNTLSVLTAINIADDLLKMHDQFDALTKENEALVEENKKLKIEMSLYKDGPNSSTSSLANQNKGKRFDGYK